MTKRDVFKTAVIMALFSGINLYAGGFGIFRETNAPTRGQKAWVDGTVVSLGHSTDGLGNQFPTATVVLYDPTNSNPRSREQVWVIEVRATRFGKTMVDLSVNSSFRAYQVGGIGGFIAIRYTDKKDHEKEELHWIYTSLGLDEIPQSYLRN